MRLTSNDPVDAVADFADLISVCAQLRAEAREGDGTVWAATSALIAESDPRLAVARTALRLEQDASKLEALAAAAVGREALDAALERHRGRIAPLALGPAG